MILKGGRCIFALASQVNTDAQSDKEQNSGSVPDALDYISISVDKDCDLRSDIIANTTNEFETVLE